MKKRYVIVTILTLLLFVSIFFLDTITTDVEEKVIDLSCPNCNVIIIIVDTLRADHVGTYGYFRNTTPYFDEIGGKNIIFEDVRAQASCTFPSVNSILTSQYPQKIIKRYNPEEGYGIPDDFPNIVKVMKNEGYETSAVSASVIQRKSPAANNKYKGNFGHEFDFFEESCLWKSAYCVNDRVFNILDETRNPFFMYVHYIDPHGDYNPPKNFTRRFGINYQSHDYIMEGKPEPIENVILGRGEAKFNESDIEFLKALYDDEILFWDSQFQELIRFLDKKEMLNNTIIVVASDHGEAFYEHKVVKHCYTVYDNEIKVPLLIIHPKISKGIRVNASFENIDIVPTLIEMLGLENKKRGFKGISMVDAIAKKGGVGKKTYSLQNNFRSVYDGKFKYIIETNNSNHQLYNIELDPDEQNNLVLKNTDIAARLNKTLAKWISNNEKNFSEKDSEKVSDRLKAMGYIA